ncbi:MAG: hypothetical protein MRZ95_04520 [Bacteroides thetaiotaomicron]|nr:hypothetical protein [Bacteroides thetaiotaomicron]MCF2631145.1 hypothetical protein [Bacteroides thetaiotaomicron]MCI5906698.1 hypothetical protein [Bacteroides thetaiotaomicron]MDC2012827.1 hypothetical protein [Bacteroides thetaiotaomicron]MDC2017200.1 hypothetical protein [Bacteroides thetaiotaomicron]MDC2035323.1 hypothetical protein [Bacteroides thetaiotaomicron]
MINRITLHEHINTVSLIDAIKPDAITRLIFGAHGLNRDVLSSAGHETYC